MSLVWPDSYLIPGIKPYHQEEAGIIYCADCREILPKLPKVDLVLTDPPYGTDFDYYSKGRGGCLAKQKDFGFQTWNKNRVDTDTILLLIKKAPLHIIWGGIFYTDALPVSTEWLVWDKDNSGNWGDCELAWTSMRGSIRKYKYRWNGMLQENMKNKDDRYHPTQKPIALMKWCITHVSGVETILDPFLGSGTTAVAAKELGRKFIGIEISEEYCRIAVKRLRQGVLDFNAPN